MYCPVRKFVAKFCQLGVYCWMFVPEYRSFAVKKLGKCVRKCENCQKKRVLYVQKSARRLENSASTAEFSKRLADFA